MVVSYGERGMEQFVYTLMLVLLHVLIAMAYGSTSGGLLQLVPSKLCLLSSHSPP